MQIVSMVLVRRVVLALCGAGLVAQWSTPRLAFAESAPPVTEVVPAATLLEKAREVFANGVRAYEEKRYKDAIDLFKEANRITSNPAFSFNIGIAYEDMGDPAMALRNYRDYMRQVPDAPDRDSVDQRIERIEDMLAVKNLQQVSVISEPPGARLSIDGQPVGVTPWTAELPPGHHVLSAELAGYREEVRDFDLPRRRSIDVPVTLNQARAAAVNSPAVSDASNVASPSVLEPIRPETWGIFGAGVASLGVALAFEVTRAGLLSDARAEPVQVDSARLLDRAHASEAWGRGFLMLGSGLTLTSALLAYLNYDSRVTRAVALGCAGSGCGLSVSGRF